MRAFRLCAVQFVKLAKRDFQLRFFVRQNGLRFLSDGLHPFGVCAGAFSDANVSFAESEDDSTRSFIVQCPLRSGKATLLRLLSPLDVHWRDLPEVNSCRVPTFLGLRR